MKFDIRNSTSAIVALAAFAVAQTVIATDGRYREYVIGERAGAMGGAAVAVSRDVDAIYYNPAGLSKSQGDSISLSANLYGLEHYTQKQGLGSEDDDSSSFVSVPGAMGGVMRISDEWAAGFGVFAPKKEKRHLVSAINGKTRFCNYDYDDQTLTFGPAASWSPEGSRFSFGAGLFGIYRDYSVSESYFERGIGIMNGACDLKTLGMLGSIGVQVDLGDGWSAGAAFQTPTVRLWDEGTLSLVGSTHDGTSRSDDYGIYTEDVRADNYIPWQLAAGIGRTVPGKWGFALDAIYHPSRDFDFMRWSIDGEHADYAKHLHSVLDASIGGEYFITEHYPIRAGFYTAFSATRVPENPNAAEFETSDIDVYGVTFSVGHKGDNMSLNLGLDYAFGQGHDLGTGEDGEDIVASCKRRVLLATISTTYYF